MSMTSRERLLTVLEGRIPDCVPVAPDISNMVPARLTGKPFWNIYLYNDPPIWEAYIAAVKHFNIDSLMDGFFPLVFDDISSAFQGGFWQPPWESREEPKEELEQFIVFKNEERIIVQSSYIENKRRKWIPKVDVYYIANSPTLGVPVEKIGISAVPDRWQPLEGVRPVDMGPEGLKKVKNLMGAQGLVGAYLTTSCVFYKEEDIYKYYDNADKHEQWAQQRIEMMEERFKKIMDLEVKPDFLCVGGSGTLVFQSEEMFRQLTFPAVKRAIELATEAGFFTHVHSCGPEKKLVKIFAEETDLSVIDPLEVPPMGDCDLAELKKLYGNKMVLKGNLHTTDVMLNGTVDDVIRASKKAIDDAGKGGGFILSTGDQCGRDTPDENIAAMIETARTYGRY